MISSSTGADVSDCSKLVASAVLLPGVENALTCDVVVSVSQDDFDNAAGTNAQKEVRIQVDAAVMNQLGSASDDDTNAVTLDISPAMELVVTATPATIVPTTGE